MDREQISGIIFYMFSCCGCRTSTWWPPGHPPQFHDRFLTCYHKKMIILKLIENALITYIFSVSLGTFVASIIKILIYYVTLLLKHCILYYVTNPLGWRFSLNSTWPHLEVCRISWFWWFIRRIQHFTAWDGFWPKMQETL